jgi:hypothetical protein
LDHDEVVKLCGHLFILELAEVLFGVEYLHLNLPALTVFADATESAASLLSFGDYILFDFRSKDYLGHFYGWLFKCIKHF